MRKSLTGNSDKRFALHLEMSDGKYPTFEMSVVYLRFEDGTQYPSRIYSSYDHPALGLSFYDSTDKQALERGGMAFTSLYPRWRGESGMSVDTLEHAHKTLKAIATKLNSIRDKYGAPATLGDFVKRVADTIGVEYVIYENTSEAREQGAERYSYRSVGSGASMLNNWVEAQRKRLTAPAEETADAS